MFLVKSKANAFIQTFHDITSDPFGYIMLDFRAQTFESKRVLTNLLDDAPISFSFEPYGGGGGGGVVSAEVI